LLKSRSEVLEGREGEIDAIRENLDVQLKILAKKKEELDSANERFISELENIAKLSEAAAKEQLLEAIRAKAQTDAMAIEKEAVNQARTNAAREAKKIVIQTIQRMCAEYTIENTVSVFNLESDDIKGQIIGREGRNIRALEAATGAEIVVDDTPEAIVISSFDPIRREVFRLGGSQPYLHLFLLNIPGTPVVHDSVASDVGFAFRFWDVSAWPSYDAGDFEFEIEGFRVGWNRHFFFRTVDRVRVGVVECGKLVPFRGNLKPASRSCRFDVIFEGVEVSNRRGSWNGSPNREVFSPLENSVVFGFDVVE